MTKHKFISLIMLLALLFTMAACVDQHPELTESSQQSGETQSPRLIATSPAVAQICSRLDLELVGVCQTSSTLPEEYQDLPQVGMPMNPDLEIIKSLNPDYVLSPATLQNDLQPKYAAAEIPSLFLNLKKQYPHIFLILVLPCRTQAKFRKTQDIAEYERIKSLTDKVVYISK